MTSLNPPITNSRPIISLSWAAYLGCSWTWCIGMFLPVLLVRDYGLAGWFVFAIPNVIGAAAMGWILARPGTSERIVNEHRHACVSFSLITLAFHAFFLAWMAYRVIPVEWCFAAVGIGSASFFLFRKKRSIDWVLAWLVLGISLAVLVRGLVHFNISEKKGLKDPFDLVELVPVCIFGFGLCPYLDLTFHKAKQATTPRAGKIAFGFGFGLFFLAMIVLTLLYEGDFVHGYFGSFGAAGLRTWVAIHLCAQTGFTWAAHLRSLPKPRLSDIPAWFVAVLLAAVGGIFVWIPKYEKFDLGNFDMLTGEAIYRIFMSFYGLIFPAYVWLCMVPLRGRSHGPSARAMLVLTLAVLIAAPMYWMGFIQGRMIWLLPGLAIVLLSRLVLELFPATGV